MLHAVNLQTVLVTLHYKAHVHTLPPSVGTQTQLGAPAFGNSAGSIKLFLDTKEKHKL